MATCRDNIDAVMHRRGVSPDAYIAPTLAGNWAPFGSGYQSPGYYRDVTNRVWLRGVAGVLPTIGTSTQAPPANLFTLPAGYVPAATCLLGSLGYTGSVYTAVVIQVTTGGVVAFQAQATGTAVVWVTLEGLSFSVN